MTSSETETTVQEAPKTEQPENTAPRADVSRGETPEDAATAQTPRRKRRDGRSKKRPGREAQRQFIVDAAVRLFAEQGTGTVSIQDICAAADVSRPTFYRCFDNKDALVAYLYQVAVRDPMRLNLAAVLDQAADADAVQRALHTMVDRIFAHPELAAFLFVESADQSSAAHAIVNEAFDEATDRLHLWYRDRGATPPSRTAIRGAMAACQWIAHDAIRRGLDDDVRDDAKAAMWELMHALFFVRRR